MSRKTLSRGLLLFWSSWFSLVFASNVADGLHHAGLLPAEWHFASGNLSLIRQTMEIYSSRMLWPGILFAAVVLVQFGTTVLFWRAFVDGSSVVEPDDRKVLEAFSPAIGLFAGFLVADEVLIVYERIPGIATSHLLILCGLLLSYVVIYLHRQAR